MNCVKCNDSGWRCEKHSDKPQGHRTDEPDYAEYCPCAGMACDCEAFPHKPKHKFMSMQRMGEAFKEAAIMNAELTEWEAAQKFKPKKPREFWLSKSESSFATWESQVTSYLPQSEWEDFKEALHVRESVEIKTEEIEWAAKSYVGVETYSIITKQEYKAFEAGARWAIARMKGEP